MGSKNPEGLTPQDEFFFPFSLAEAGLVNSPLPRPFGDDLATVVCQPFACILCKTNGHPSIGYTVSISTLATLLGLIFYQPGYQVGPHQYSATVYSNQWYLYYIPNLPDQSLGFFENHLLSYCL